jgi:hypothetical protein
MVLLDFDFYTDSIGDKPVKMLETNEPQRSQDEDQEKFCPGDGPAHDVQYPFIEEFSELLQKVSTDVLKFKLMTYQQRQLAEAMWAAANYGGSEAKCAKHLKDIYGSKWYEMTSIADHMEDIRPYCEYVLILDHQKQWKDSEKLAKLSKINGSKCQQQRRKTG